MKVSRIIVIIIVILIVAIAAVLLVGALSPPPPECTSVWNCGADYPLRVGGNYGIAGQQCVNNTSTVFCIGGEDVNGGPRNEIFYGSLSSNGNITAWTSNAQPYPIFINGQSCVSQTGYVYCVGGSYNDVGDDVATSYFAQVVEGTIGNWSRTTAFPVPIDSQSCVASSSYVYCVGGNNETDGSNADSEPSNSVWFAQLSSGGIGPWVHTTTYPGDIFFPSCTAGGGYIYCLGGADINGNSVSTAFYAPLSANGVGAWISATAYPVQASGQACSISSGYIFCVGGETSGGQSPSYTNAVYYATVSSAGIGKWQKGPDFPTSVGTTCLVVSGSTYCVGGFDESSTGENSYVRYASLSALKG